MFPHTHFDTYTEAANLSSGAHIAEVDHLDASSRTRQGSCLINHMILGAVFAKCSTYGVSVDLFRKLGILSIRPHSVELLTSLSSSRRMVNNKACFLTLRQTVNSSIGSLACSPFHVRFGKFSLLRPSEKKVYMLIPLRPYS